MKNRLFKILLISSLLMASLFMNSAIHSTQAGIYSCDNCDYGVSVEITLIFADSYVSEPWWDNQAELRIDVGYSDPNHVTEWSHVNEYITLQTFEISKHNTDSPGTTVTLEGGVSDGMVLYINIYEIDVGFDDYVNSGEAWVDGTDDYEVSADKSGLGATVTFTVG